MSTADLLERNLKVFERAFPDLALRLRTLARPLSQVVRQDDAAVDIHLRTGLLYKQDARAQAQEQVDAFTATPYRLFYSLPLRSNFTSRISQRVFDGMMRNLDRNGVSTLPTLPSVPSGYLVILGVGLGYHIPLLLDRLSSPHVVIVEPFEEFLFHSLHAIDWGAIVERCEREGRTLHLFCAPDAEGMSNAIGSVFESANPTVLDGTYLFSHYPLWELAETRRRLINEMPRRMIAIGYYDDERKMLCNTASNMHRMDFRLLEGKVRPRGNTPVFLVGSGPSFDQSVEFIRQWQDHAVIFSAGSALPLLLSHGIVPDFHCELENGPEQYEKTLHVLNRFPEMFPDGKLTGIRLIASATQNPRVPPLFEEAFFFFREAVTSTTTFGNHHMVLRGSAPTCSNTAMAAAACLGFGDIYLFGYDCGWRNSREHHAKESIYYTNALFKTEEEKALLTLPGNFGGEISTNLLFDWSRNILQQCIRAYRLPRVFNCSDGAVIEGAIPKVPEALEFSAPIDRDAIVARIRAETPAFAANTFFSDFNMAPAAAELRDYVAQLDAIIDRALAGDVEFGTFVEEAWQMIRGHADKRMVVGLIYFSTVGELKHAALFINRVADAERRRAVTRDFLKEFRALHHELLAESLTLLDDIAGLFANRAVPEWATAGLPA